MVYNPTNDERVIGVKNYAMAYSLDDLIEEFTDLEISDLIKFTRSPEGAFNKFCREIGIDNPTEVVSERALKASRVPLSQIADPDELVVEMEIRGLKIESCPICYMMKTRSGACECTTPDEDFQAKLHYTPKKMVG